jgi:hypothetical protein
MLKQCANLKALFQNPAGPAVRMPIVIINASPSFKIAAATPERTRPGSRRNRPGWYREIGIGKTTHVAPGGGPEPGKFNNRKGE